VTVHATRVRVTVDATFFEGVGSTYRVTADDDTGRTYYAALNSDEATAHVNAILARHRGATPEAPTPTVTDILDAVLRPEPDPDDD